MEQTNKFSKTIIGILGIVSLVGVAFSLYSYIQLTEFKKNPQRVVQEDIKELTARVGRHIVLPEGEVPTVKTISNASLLKDLPFFAKAKKGYRVLIYFNAKKAILYDPAADKIVEVAFINVGPAPGAQETPSSVPQQDNNVSPNP